MMKSLFFAILITGTMVAQTLTECKNKLENLFKDSSEVYALAFKEIGNNKNTILINEKEFFHAASTMKTPVMVEVFNQVKLKKISLDDSIVIKNEFTSIVDGSKYSMNLTEDSGEQMYKFLGKKRTINDVLYDMVTVSSNLGANLLIDIVKPVNIMRTLAKYNVKGVNVLRGVEDIKAYDKNLNNTTNASGLLTLYEKIAEGKVISKKACSQMIKIMLEQKFNTIIPKYLPESVKVAHKTGSVTGVRHDNAIVYLPDGRKYVLILLSKNLMNIDKGIEKLAEASKIIYDYMVSKAEDL